MKIAQRAGPKREYLPATERRRRLLVAIGAVFDRSGFGGITMVAVAAEAGVSRRLVYDHFGDLESLLVAFVEDRLVRYRSGLPDLPTGSTDDAAVAAFRHLLTVPATDRRLVRLLVADAATPGLARVRQRFCAAEIARWPGLPRAHGPRRRAATAMVWTASSALLALADSVTDGDVTPEFAEEVAVSILRAIASGRRATALRGTATPTWRGAPPPRSIR